MYARLERVEAVVGALEGSRRRTAALLAAVVLERARRQTGLSSLLAD